MMRLQGELDVDPLFTMATQIPAWGIASVREQGMNTGLILWLIVEYILDFVVLLVHCVIPLHRNCCESIFVLPGAIMKLRVVAGVSQDRDCNRDANSVENKLQSAPSVNDSTWHR